MNEESRQGAMEIVEAGLGGVQGPYGNTWDALNLKFLAVADARLYQRW